MKNENKTYEISFSVGLAWPEIRRVEVQPWQSEFDALDLLIDRMESDGEEFFFVPDDELATTPDDEYIVGGNSSRALRHYGLMSIKLVA